MSRHTRRLVIALALACSATVAGQVGPPRIDVRLQAERISIDEIARFFPAIRDMELPPAVRITRFEAEGPLDRVNVTFAAASPAGEVTGELIVDAHEPQRSARGQVHMRNLELARLTGNERLPEQLTATVAVDVACTGDNGLGIAGTYELSSPAIAVAGYDARSIQARGRIEGRTVTVDATGLAYGGQVSTEGRIAFSDEVRYELRGAARSVNLLRLPRHLDNLRVASDLSFEYHLAGTGSDAQGRLTFDTSEILGAQVAAGTRATFDTSGAEVAYTATGGVSNADLQRIARAFDLDVLATDRFATDVDARFEISGFGSTLQSATAELTEATLFGGSLPHASLVLRTVGNELQFTAQGQFRNVQPAVLLQRPQVDGELTGAFDVRGSVPNNARSNAWSSLDLQGTLTLASSVFEALPIERGNIAATLDDGVRLQIKNAELMSGTARATVTGVYGLEPSVTTMLDYHVGAPFVNVVADVFQQPLRGGVAFDGRVTGNDVLDVNGTLAGAELAYREVTVQKLSGHYAVAVPRDDLNATDVEAQITATEVAVAGQTIDTVSADVTYLQGRGEFEIAASQAEHSLDMAGSLSWHPDHQELHFSRLTLGTPAGTWRLEPGVQPTIDYSGRRVVVSDLRLLAEPDQLLTINGAVGASGAPLRVVADNLRLSALGAWSGQFAVEGTLDADATISGDLSAPDVTATFSAAAGSIRGVAYRTVSGRLNYQDQRTTFDVRLVQPDNSWIAAEGGVPTSLITAGEPNPEAPLDVTITSSLIDLDIVQTLTTAVAEVGGGMQVDARIIGPLESPTLSGMIALRDGAFTVPALGTRYTRLNSNILLQENVLVVEDLRVYDEDDDWLSVSGRLPVAELLKGSVSLIVQADGFEVIDNSVAQLELDALLRIDGRLRQPDVAGTLYVVDGRISVDEVLDLDRSDAYATTAAGEPQQIQSSAEGVLEEVPVALNLDLRAPTLLLEGTDLRGPGDLPVGLGDINVTANGGVRLLKRPDGALRVEGVVETVRGTYELQNREFELVRGGTIRFIGTDDINPLLNVTARRTIDAVQAEVHIVGTLEEPRIELTSQPPLDPADILSLVVFNVPTIQLGADQQVSLARRAAALGAGFLADQVTEALAEAFGLDLLDVEATTVNGGSTIAPVVTVGEQLGDFFVRYRQQVGGEAPSQVVIEYQVNDWLRLQSAITNQSDSGRPLLRRLDGSGIDAVFSWQFGGADGQATETRGARRKTRK